MNIRTIDLTEQYASNFHERGIIEVIGFVRLGPASTDHPILDTRLGCKFVFDARLCLPPRRIEFDAHAHSPHLVPELTIRFLNEVVTCEVELPGPYQEFTDELVKSVICIYLDAALEASNFPIVIRRFRLDVCGVCKVDRKADPDRDFYNFIDDTDNTICVPCYKSQCERKEQERLKDLPVERDLISRGYHHRRHLFSIRPRNKEGYTVGFDDPSAVKYELEFNEEFLYAEFETLNEAFDVFLKEKERYDSDPEYEEEVIRKYDLYLRALKGIK